MTAVTSDTLLLRLSEFVAERLGLHFPRERWSDLERRLCSAAGEFGMPDLAACAAWLLSAPLTREKLDLLASHLTVGETYFFREKQIFEVLEKRLLPALIQSRTNEKRLRVWSAGCATGEEPYSLAILLSSMLPGLSDWNISILATDINPRFLKKAAEGIYSQWSFRDTPSWAIDRYFKSVGRKFEILPHIRQMVTFSYLNLAEDSYPSLLNNTNAMDLIFCRNVLMYFVPQRARKAVQNLGRALVENGWLVTSQTEVSQTLFSDLGMVVHDGCFLYRKSAPVVLPSPALSTPPEPPAIHLPEPEAIQTRKTVEKPVKRKPRVHLFEEALALYRQGRYIELITGLSPRAQDAREMALLARSYANLGKLTDSLAWCQQAVALDKLNADYRHLLADIQQELGQTGEAVTSLRQALYLDPGLVLAHFALGSLTRRQGRHKESHKHFENALSLIEKYLPDDILPESDGVTAGRLKEIILGMTGREIKV